MKEIGVKKLIIYSLFAGVCIAFAAFVYLYASSVSGSGAWEKAVCSLLFGFGLYFIIVMEYKLFTGMVPTLVDIKPSQWWTLVVCYAFNTLGIFILCLLVFLTDNAVSRAITERAVSVTQAKLSNGLFGSFISAVFCGNMITFAVKAHQNARLKGLSGTLCILFPVVLFVYLGFEHCIANQAYIFLAVLGKADMDITRLILFAALTALGNIVGGVMFPIGEKIANFKRNKPVSENNETEE